MSESAKVLETPIDCDIFIFEPCAPKAAADGPQARVPAAPSNTASYPGEYSSSADAGLSVVLKTLSGSPAARRASHSLDAARATSEAGAMSAAERGGQREGRIRGGSAFTFADALTTEQKDQQRRGSPSPSSVLRTVDDFALAKKVTWACNVPFKHTAVGFPVPLGAPPCPPQ